MSLDSFNAAPNAAQRWGAHSHPPPVRAGTETRKRRRTVSLGTIGLFLVGAWSLFSVIVVVKFAAVFEVDVGDAGAGTERGDGGKIIGLIMSDPRRRRVATGRIALKNDEEESRQWASGANSTAAKAPTVETTVAGSSNADRIAGFQQQHETNKSNAVIPFVFMVHKRVEYLKKSIESLRKSDFPKLTTPIIFSHDGHVHEMVSFVASLKEEFPKLVQIFHPHSCYDHPHAFPADDASLNEGYAGDKYGNPRSDWATCAKHHFWWMVNAAWSMDLNAEYMFFTEEDYEVAPTIYETIGTGVALLDSSEEPYFGLILEKNKKKVWARSENVWVEDQFRTNPMVIGRETWRKIHGAADDFCRFDDYNWDWSVVHLQTLKIVPSKVLRPGLPQVRHIGEVGMHGDSGVTTTSVDSLRAFHGKRIGGRLAVYLKPAKGNGGWGHPMDHRHCLEVADNATIR